MGSKATDSSEGLRCSVGSVRLSVRPSVCMTFRKISHKRLHAAIRPPNLVLPRMILRHPGASTKGQGQGRRIESGWAWIALSLSLSLSLVPG